LKTYRHVAAGSESAKKNIRTGKKKKEYNCDIWGSVLNQTTNFFSAESPHLAREKLRCSKVLFSMNAHVWWFGSMMMMMMMRRRRRMMMMRRRRRMMMMIMVVVVVKFSDLIGP